MDYIYSFFKSSDPTPIPVQTKCEDEKFSIVDSNSLIWDINNLNLNELENKYNCSFSMLANLLKESGCKVFSSQKQPHKIIKVPRQYPMTTKTESTYQRV